jgi:SAM-dependent methyltransferase
MTPDQGLRSPRRPPNFDPVARVYRWAEYLALGPLLQRTRSHFLPQIMGARYALVLGDGDGRFLARLLRRAPALRAVAVDASVAMLRLLRTRCAFAGHRLDTRVAVLPEFPSGIALADVDLVVTHFFLDCLSQVDLERLAKELAQTVQPGCLWVISEFGLPRRQPWRLAARLYVRGLYFAFRVLAGLRTQSLPDIEGSLTHAGFTRIHRMERLKGLLFSEVWRLAEGDPGSHRLSSRATSPLQRSSTLE